MPSCRIVTPTFCINGPASRGGKPRRLCRRFRPHRNPRSRFHKANRLLYSQKSFLFRRNKRPASIVEMCDRALYLSVPYNRPSHMPVNPPDQEWKKGSAELLVLSLLEDQPRHGYDISKLIQIRSGGALRFHVTSLYPLLHRLESEGLIVGRWVEKAEQRRRRYYSLTSQGRKILRSKQKSWKDFVAVISRITGIEHA